MGTNVALDLDDRPMPRGPIFPRCVALQIVTLFLTVTCGMVFAGGVDDVRDALTPRMLILVVLVDRPQQPRGHDPSAV